MGYSLEAGAAMSRALCTILTSTFEGNPRVVSESMSRGTPSSPTTSVTARATWCATGSTASSWRATSPTRWPRPGGAAQAAARVRPGVRAREVIDRYPVADFERAWLDVLDRRRRPPARRLRRPRAAVGPVRRRVVAAVRRRRRCPVRSGRGTRRRKVRVRASCGSLMTAAGSPRSTMTPPSMNSTWSATCCGEPHLVGHDDHRPALVGEVLHDRQHLADELGVERRGRLVEQHELGPHRQRPGDADALLLTARQLERVLVGLLGQAHLLQQRARLGLGLLRGRLWTRTGPSMTFSQHGLVREQVVRLEDHAALGPQPVAARCFARRGRAKSTLDVADAHDARVGRLERVERTQQVVLPDPTGR